MANTIRVDPQDPLGSAALEPIGRRLHDPACEEIVALASFVSVFVERGDDHPRFELDAHSGLVGAGVLVGDAADEFRTAIIELARAA